MPLQPSAEPLPPAVAALAADATQCAERIAAATGPDRIASFVMCHGPLVWRILRAVQGQARAREPGPSPGRPTRFLELGSGLGLATSLAQGLGCAATGLELAPRLVDEARALAHRHGLEPDFVCGSYRQIEGSSVRIDGDERSGSACRHLSLADIDVFFAYPWPAEKRYLTELVGQHAQPGACLVFYHGGAQWQALIKPRPAPP